MRDPFRPFEILKLVRDADGMARRLALALWVAFLVLLLAATERAAGDDRSASVGGTISVVNMQATTDLSLSAPIEYAFNRVVGLEIEGTVAPRLRAGIVAPVIQTAPDVIAGYTTTSNTLVQVYPVMFSNPGGRLIILSNNVRLDIPTTLARVSPYFVAGGGIGHMRHTADLTYTPVIASTPGLASFPIPPSRPITEGVLSAETDLALTLGGGVEVRVAGRVAMGAHLRIFRLLGAAAGQNIGRFGVGLRYRF